ncbi:MAG: hypothetical protein JNM13_09180 [Hyphomicrobiaceae bacterium]|nr:hypothetical protein [Hyphomicrobiaceae bacterium]
MATQTQSKAAFEQAVIDLIAAILERRGVSVVVAPDTELFEGRLIDSVSFAELLGAIEAELDVEVPDHMLSTEHFRTPAIIARTFAPGS